MVALVEPRMAGRAREAAAKLDGERVEVLEGDISDRRLGLSDDQYERMCAEVSIAYHLAAIYNLAVPLEVAQRVNVDGTGNVLELCADCERLERLHYVSTAYVAGDRTGVVYEHELALGQGFKNHYESTKFQAEVWVRERWTATRRRSCARRSSSATRRRGDREVRRPYYSLHHRVSRRWGAGPQCSSAAAAPPSTSCRSTSWRARWRSLPTTTRWSGDAAPRRPRAAHVARADAHPLPSVRGKEPSYRSAKGIELSLRSKRVRRAFSGAPPESIVYLNHPVRFDTRRASGLLARHGLRCPRFEEYVGPMVEFFRLHEDDPFFAPAA